MGMHHFRTEACAERKIQSFGMGYVVADLMLRANEFQIRYTASATISSVSDCRRPVALDQAKSIPGLMCILERNYS